MSVKVMAAAVQKSPQGRTQYEPVSCSCAFDRDLQTFLHDPGTRAPLILGSAIIIIESGKVVRIQGQYTKINCVLIHQQ